MICDECDGSGVVNWTCSEGTCDMTEWCECPAGDQARADYALVCAEYQRQQEEYAAKREKERLARADEDAKRIRERYLKRRRERGLDQLRLW